MTNISKTANSLEEHVKLLLENYTFLKDENEFLFDKVAMLEQQLNKELQRFDKLKETYNTLKLAKTIDGSIENSKETKSKINALIREVDSCIKQLSE